VHFSLLLWFLRVASSVTRVDVRDPFDNADLPGCLPQLLATAALSAPKLEALKMPLRTSSSLNSVFMMACLTCLQLDQWKISEDDDLLFY
jgi:hypothetical protein